MSKLYRNVLLNRLLSHVFEELEPSLERVRPEPLQLLATASETLPHVYFPETAIIGVLAPVTGHHQLGVIGREGVINNVFPTAEEQMPWTMKVQAGGSAWRILSDKLALAVEHHSDLRALLLRASRVEQIQLVSTGWSAPHRGVEARLARWLLMYFDRIDGVELRVTHAALSLIVGMRRPTTTHALHVMEGEGIIACKRNSIVLRNRQKLIKVSGSLCGFAEGEYERFIGVDFRTDEHCETSLSVPEIMVTGPKSLSGAVG